MQSGISASIAAPYADALMSIAERQDTVDAIGEDISNLRQMLAESDELNQFLTNPVVNIAAKRGVLAEVIREGFDDSTKKFLMLLVDRGRILFLDAICEQYQARLREKKGIALAEVTSAIELDEERTNAIREKVKSFSGASDVEVSVSVDPELIGGVIVKVGSQVVDASLRGQLRRLALSLG